MQEGRQDERGNQAPKPEEEPGPSPGPEPLAQPPLKQPGEEGVGVGGAPPWNQPRAAVPGAQGPYPSWAPGWQAGSGYIDVGQGGPGPWGPGYASWERPGPVPPYANYPPPQGPGWGYPPPGYVQPPPFPYGQPEGQAGSFEASPLYEPVILRRLVSFVLDNLIVLVVMVLIWLLIGPAHHPGALSLEYLAISLLYHVGFIGGLGQTPAMRVFRIAIVDQATYRKIGYARAFGRWFILYVLLPIFLIPLVVDLIIMLFNKRSQGIQDMVAADIVIRVR